MCYMAGGFIIQAEGSLVLNHSGGPVGKGYSAWFKYYRKILLNYMAGSFLR